MKAVFVFFCKKGFKVNIRISSLALVEEPLPQIEAITKRSILIDVPYLSLLIVPTAT